MDAILAAVKVSGVISLSTMLVCVAPAVKTVIITNVSKLAQYIKLFGIKAGMEHFIAIRQFQAVPDVPKSVMTVLATELTDGDDQEYRFIDYADDVVQTNENVWIYPAMKRGKEIDDLLGNNLGYNYPVIDKLENRVITSIKSMDTNLKSYQSANKIFDRIVKYTKQLSKLTGKDWNNKMVTKKDFDSRVLQLALPNTTITAELYMNKNFNIKLMAYLTIIQSAQPAMPPSSGPNLLQSVTYI